MLNNSASSSQSPEVIVVEASAGSGKTYRLAKRYLSLLINPRLDIEHIPLRSILAITFTNKATVEMKERILEFLKRIAFDSFTSKEIEQDLFESLKVEKVFARQKAGRIMDELIRHYSFFQIQTIDSFINALLLGCALRIGRSSHFAIKRDYQRYLNYCLDVVIEQAAHDTAVYTLLEDFLEHYLFVENQKGWFPKEDILDLMASLFKLCNKYGGVFEAYAIKGSDVIKKKIELFKEIVALAEHAPEGMHKQAQNSLLNFVRKSDEIFGTKDLPAKLQDPQVPMNKNVRCPAAYEKKWQKVHESIKELVELEATAFYNPYIQLFHRMLDSFQTISRKEDVLFLEELNRTARSLFGEDGVTVAELYYRLATRFRHYLIDEFQDTSILQWRNLHIMVEEALSTGGSLFYVGDKKQAIYRFRGGESRLFDTVKQEFTHFNVRDEQLAKNWRSQRAIVEFNNRIFSEDNLRKALQDSGIAEELFGNTQQQDEIIAVFKDASQEYRKDLDRGYVQVERLSEDSQQERNKLMQEKVLSLIKELHARFHYEDITILARDNEEVELVTSWLLSADIPVESEKTLNILQNHLIKELVSFLTFLQSPIDDLSFATFILGDVFSSISGISREAMREFMFTQRKERRDPTPISLYHRFREAYPRVWDTYIDAFFKSVGFISGYELCISIYQRFAIMDTFPSAQAFFMKLLELVKEKEDEYVGLGELLAYLKDAQEEDLYVSVPQSDSVKILTIHKAKGLEFPAVIIPFLRIDINPETAGKGTASYVIPVFRIPDEWSGTSPLWGSSEADEQKLGLVRIPKYSIPYSERLKAIFADAYKKGCIDEVNALYVALTRAQHELYVFIPAKSGVSKNKARFLIPEELISCGAQHRYAKKKKENEQSFLDVPLSHYKEWKELLKDEFGDAQSIQNRSRILQGNVLHRMLFGISVCTEKNVKDLIASAVEDVRIQYPFLTDFTHYEQKLDRLLHKKELKPFFFVTDGEVHCEKTVVNHFGDTKRIDRLIMSDKEAIVVDYKSTRDNHDAHVQQIKEYMSIIVQLYPKKHVTGYLLYLDELNMERLADAG